jgi:hypothetical protein
MRPSRGAAGAPKGLPEEEALARLRAAASIYARAAIRAARAAALTPPPAETPIHDDDQTDDGGISPGAAEAQ